MRGQFNLPAFRKAYRDKLERFEILRTQYLSEGAGYRQETILMGEVPELEIWDLTDTPEAERELELWKVLRPMFEQILPLDQGPLKLKLLPGGRRQPYPCRFCSSRRF